jgi:alpha-glucuronidase
MWKEFLDADTYAKGKGSFASRIVDGTLDGEVRTGIAGVANTGNDVNWCGHHFAQANWFAFGRLAWNPALGSDAIAEEWIRMTWSHDPEVVSSVKTMMLDSRETFVRYTMPLGLHHLIGGDHYAPMPENPDPRRPDWSALYYHRADATAIGFDRSSKGSGAVEQYRSPLREEWGNPATCPENLLLWFHRVAWTREMKSGRTLWNELVHEYAEGARGARDLETRWTALEGKVDTERYRAVLEKLHVQAQEAAAWADKCVRYFRPFAEQPPPTP